MPELAKCRYRERWSRAQFFNLAPDPVIRVREITYTLADRAETRSQTTTGSRGEPCNGQLQYTLKLLPRVIEGKKRKAKEKRTRKGKQQ